MGISKTQRFEVFKRDEFQCRYCGQTPPSVILEVDHIIPASKGGDDAPENLITACFDCNRGKGARELETVMPSLLQTAEQIAEKEAQMAAYKKILHASKRRQEKDVDAIEKIFIGTFKEYNFKDKFRTSVRRNFLSKVPVDELVDAMQMACDRVHEPERAIKYFCGIAWNLVKKQSGGQPNA